MAVWEWAKLLMHFFILKYLKLFLFLFLIKLHKVLMFNINLCKTDCLSFLKVNPFLHLTIKFAIPKTIKYHLLSSDDSARE